MDSASKAARFIGGIVRAHYKKKYPLKAWLHVADEFAHDPRTATGWFAGKMQFPIFALMLMRERKLVHRILAALDRLRARNDALRLRFRRRRAKEV